MHWIDLALFGDEASLATAIVGLDAGERTTAIASVAAQLGLTQADAERAMLRLLIERARPFALPKSLWSRPVTASDDPRMHVRAHFARLGVQETSERMRRANNLYLQFVEERQKIQVRESHLKSCGYRCEHCGLAFCDEELAPKALVSPFGLRGKPKTDPLKPHWNGGDDLRYPTIDHHWPVSLYGDNKLTNLRILCVACNQGKEDYLALEQMRPFVGLPGRSQLLGAGSLSFGVFYAQLRRSPVCVNSGQDSTTAELTVQLRDPTAPAVLDNLVTVASAGM